MLETELNKDSDTGLVAGCIVALVATTIASVTVIGIVEERAKAKRPTVHYINDWKQDGVRSKSFILPDGRLGMMYAGKLDLPDSWPCNDFGRLSEVVVENVNTCIAVIARAK